VDRERPNLSRNDTVTFTAVGDVETIVACTGIVPVKKTEVTEPSPWAVIVRVVPAVAFVGEMPVTLVTAMDVVDTAVPPGVATVIFPLEKPAGMVVRIMVGETTVKRRQSSERA